MQTIKIKYTLDNQDDCILLGNYIKQYNHVYRVAFNNLVSGVKNKLQELSKLNNIDLLDSWFILSANYEAKFLHSSYESNSKDHEQNREENLKILKDKLVNHKITKKEYIYKKKSVLNPFKIVFGGKKNFIKRCQGKISKEEFKLNTYAPLTSYGEKKSGSKSVHGNRKFKLSEDLSFITLKLREKKILINLPKHLHSNIKSILTNVYKHQILDDCPITYKIDNQYVYILFDECIISNSKINSQKIENRILALDLNPNYIGWSIVDWIAESEFKVVKSGIYTIKELNDKDFKLKGQGFSSESKERKYLSNKRQYETILIAKNLVNKAIYYKCQMISCEDLNIKSKDSKKGSKYNKLINNLWNRTEFINNLLKRCNILNIRLQKVVPEYSSFIGNFLYRGLNLPDMVLASIELSRRTYEFYNLYISKTKDTKKNIVRPSLVMFKKLYMKSLEEFHLQPTYHDLVELYYFFKKSKMMYRLSIDQFDLLFSRLFSRKSYVGLFIF